MTKRQDKTSALALTILNTKKGWVENNPEFDPSFLSPEGVCARVRPCCFFTFGSASRRAYLLTMGVPEPIFSTAGS
jgi:hypothetical protein